MHKRYKGMVIGCGAIGVALEREPDRPKPATHAGAFSAHPQIDLIALVDLNPDTLAAACALYPDAVGHADVITALDAVSPDIVAIATGPDSHVSIVRACVERGVPMIVCEKPLARNLEDAQEIQRILGTGTSVLVVNYQRRFYPLIARVRDEVRNGALGRIQQASCFYSNGLYNNGGHLIDALLYVLDERIDSATGRVNKRNVTHPAQDPNVDCLLFTEGGISIAMQSFDQKVYGASEIRIFGEHGAIFIREYGFTVVHVPVVGSRFAGVQHLDYDRGTIETEPLSAVEGALDHAIDCYENHKEPISSVTSAMETVRILDLVVASVREK